MSEAIYVKRMGNAAAYVVDGREMLLLGAEVHNSSGSSLEFMQANVWPQLKTLNVNCALVTACWELIEPEEGKYDFSLVQGLIDQARDWGMKLIFLWFGSWKNSHSTYVPEWVKTDADRFFRVRNERGHDLPIISCLCDAAREADAAAYAKLMEFIAAYDGAQHTVIGMQVENEAGILGSDRDYCPAAQQAFEGAVPCALLKQLDEKYDVLLPEIKAVYKKGSAGSWQQVFGAMAEEIFSAWNYSSYIGYVAAQGKEKYDIPMYVNAWTVQYTGEWPGQYPSGGPVSRVHDIWRAGAPSLDFFAPDIYLLDFPEQCASYARGGNPLFIPEARRDAQAAANAYYAFGQLHALCFAPFGFEDTISGALCEVGGNIVQEDVHKITIDGVGEQMSAVYAQLQSAMPLLLEHYGQPTLRGFGQYADVPLTVEMGSHKICIRFTTPLDRAAFPGGGLIVQTGEDEFFFLGHGCAAFFMDRPGGAVATEYVRIDEGTFAPDGTFKPGRRLNGDEMWVRMPEGKPTALRVKVMRRSVK